MIEIGYKQDGAWKAKTVWFNKTTGEMVVVPDFKCPDGCREPTKDEELAVHERRIDLSGYAL
jgi:hypothetical protein